MNRKLTTLWRIILGGFHNFVRNAWLSVAAIAVMVITLTIVLFSWIANATFSHTVQTIRDKIDISVYLKDDVSDQARTGMVDKLKSMENVKSVVYSSKQDVLDEYKRQNSEDIDLQMAISQTDNPLPAKLVIKLNDPDRIDMVREYLESPAVKALQSDETSYSGDRRDAIDKIAKSTTFIREAGIVSVFVFAIISVLIIFNTIQMAIFNRRDELSIMRLLGAGSWYIRGPFLIETILYGIVSAVISVVLMNLLFSVSSNALNANSFGLLDISYANNYFADRFWTIVGAQLALGILIGIGSSFIATHRYLRFKAPK